MKSKKKRRDRRKKQSISTIKKQKMPLKLVKAYADLTASDPRFKILYLVPHFKQDFSEQSIFGWYTPGLHRAAAPLISISTLPADIREPFTNPKQILLFRLSRRIWPLKTPIQLDALFASVDYLKEYRFKVFISNTQQVADEIDDFINKSGWQCLHVSSVKGDERLASNELNVYEIITYCNDVIDKLELDGKDTEFVRIAREVMDPHELHSQKNHPLPKGNHNITTPNEKALAAFGRTLNNVIPVNYALEDALTASEKYVERICQGADAVMKERTNLLKTLPHELVDYRYIIAIQSIYWGHFNRWRDLISQAETINRNIIRRTYASIVQATSYFDTYSSEDLKNLINEPFFLFIKEQQAADAKSFTAGLTALSTSSFAPVLRLEPKLNKIRGDLVNLAECARAKGPHFLWKQSRLVSRISEKMRLLIDRRFLDRIDKKEQRLIEGMKLVSDIPLEIMYSGDLPLCMRFDISRIPVLPGNAFLATCFAPPIVIPIRSFQEILIIRSFRTDDPIKFSLEKALSMRLGEPSDFQIKIKFVDVTNEDEFVNALKDFQGALMIFDGHGVYDADIGAGMIVIGEKKVDAWQLKNRCTLPPIVIFSACNTQPLDGSHGSSATAAFALGALTVLGTTLPIGGNTSSVFIRRLIWRIEAFLPLMVKTPTRTTWREVISGMLRMSYITEVMSALEKNAGSEYKGINYAQVQLKANFDINQKRPNWYSNFLHEFSSLVGCSKNKLKMDIKLWASMTESMTYVQLGNPENIVIVEELPHEVLNRAMNEVD